MSRTGDGGAGAGWSTRPWFSADGSQLFFLSEAVNLVDGDLNGLPDLMVVALADAGEAVVLLESAGPAAVLLRWAGKPGKTYCVQCKDALEADWGELPGTFGAEDSVEVDTGSGARFFRLMER